MSPIANPIPSTTWRHDGHYPSDSGLDINVPVGTQCVAAASGTIEYAETRTKFDREHDSNPSTRVFDPGFSVLIALQTPFTYKQKSYSFIWYSHLNKIAVSLRPDVFIRQGDFIGKTGFANSAHLHFGILSDRRQRDASDWMAPLDVANLIWGNRQTTGAVGSLVRDFQLKLQEVAMRENKFPLAKKQGFVNGVFGPDTETVLKQFQQDRGLPPTGKMNDTTWNFLNSVG